MHKQYTLDEALLCVDTLCRSILGRPASGEGWQRHAEALQMGTITEEQMALNFIASPEFESRGKLKALNERRHDPVLLQTADPVVYREMLQVTSQTVIAYCARYKLQYECYIGIKRGAWPWHATYNRLFMLKELVDRGFRGWAVYMDADAFIADQTFDLRAYLADKAHLALIGTLALGHVDASVPGNGPHNINAGVFLINLAHPVGRDIADVWHKMYADIPEYIVRQADVFECGMASDQELLHRLLKDNKYYAQHIYHESADLLNSGRASFIRQHLRAMHSSFETRLAAISRAVNSAMRPEEGLSVGQ